MRSDHYHNGLHIQSVGLSQSFESNEKQNAYYPKDNYSALRSFLNSKAKNLMKSENKLAFKRNIDIQRQSINYNEYK